VRVKGIRGSAAALLVSAGIDGRPGTPRTLSIRIEGHGTSMEKRVAVSGRAAHASVTFDRARLWWPNGYGDQPMYTAVLTLYEGSREVDEIRVPFAVRTVRLVQRPDSGGRSFILEVNRTRLFCKGADWIPSDSFLPRVTRSRYEKLLTLARDASMNMIRVWGGGIYEDDAFYELCDRLGLMVWQDFMYACGEYPDHPAFLREAGREAEQVVRRLRNHPSIVLWCGNNECEWIFCKKNPAKGPDEMRGAPIFRDVLPRVVRRLDGTRPYWRSTPFGTGFPNDESNGNHHQWEVWSEWKDFRAYEANTARFVSEFGFQGPANRATLERALGPGDRDPQSPVMEHHNKQVEGPERLFRFIAAHYTLPHSFAGFIHAGQVLQGEALKCAVEHWRRRKFRTAGALFWQLNDCWPVTSWSVIDGDLRPKAAYFYAKRFFAPVLVSVAKRGDVLEVWGTNDTLSEVKGALSVELCKVGGGTIWRRVLKARIPANGTSVLHRIQPAEVEGADPRSTYVRVELRDGRRPPALNRYFFCEYKHLDLGRPLVTVSLKKRGPDTANVLLSASTLALAVELSSRSGDAEWSDNFVTLDPGRPRGVIVRSALPPVRLRRDLTVRALT
jgi:beta-mannosidase